MTLIFTMAVILILIVSTPFLLRRSIKDPKNLDKWAKVSGIAGGLVAALSLLFTAYTFHTTSEKQKKTAEDTSAVQKELAQENSRIQRVLAAAGIYQEHMKMSIAHPGLADGRIAPKNPGIDFCPKTMEDVQRMNDYEKYRWYVGHALYSFETILEVEDDPEWGSVAEAFIRDHHTYIETYGPPEGFPCWRYTKKLQERLTKIFGRTCPEAPKPPPPPKPQCPNIPRWTDKDL